MIKSKTKRLTVKQSLCLLVSALMVLTCPAFSGVGASAHAEFSAQEYPELRLEYESAGTPDKMMGKSLPLGNGYMGATVYGGVDRDEIQVNEHTLWSGGPGASASFDGGMNDLSSAEVHENLMTVRRGLQEEMNEFSANNSAYIDANGKVIAGDYKNNAPYISQAIENLKGEKDNFGQYQTFGSFFVEDTDSTANRLKNVFSNELATSENEKAVKLFDGNYGTKWYSLAGTPANTVQTNPCYVTAQYEKALTFNSYTIVTGNDAPGRDPADWTLSGSMDGENWTEIDVQSGQSFSERRKEYTFNLTKEATWSYIKFEVTANKSVKDGDANPWQNGVQMSELTFNEVEKEKAEPENYSRVLDLDNAIASVNYDLADKHYKREYFVSYPNNIAVMRLTADEGVVLNRRIYFDSPHTNKKTEVSETAATLTVTGAPADQTQALHLNFAGQIKLVLPNGGKVTADENSLKVNGAREILAYFTTGTNYLMCMDDTFNYLSEENPLDAVSARIQKAVELGYDKLKEAHIADFTELFGRVKLSLGNGIKKPDKPTNELIDGYISGSNSENDNRYYELLYFQFGRYLLISSSREGTLPANLQGVWCNELNPNWDSDYHTNINLQMNYWAAETTNLAECHISDIEYIKSLVPRGKITAKHYHCKEDGTDVRGWTTYHENSIWGNTAPGNWQTSFYFPTAAAWLCQDIYDYYAFNCDDEYLDEYYDVVKQAALFWVDNLVEDKRDGTLVSSPSYSPEHGPFSLGTSADQSLIWELFRNTLEFAEAKGESSSEISEIKTAMDRLAMPKIGLGGQLMEWKDETNRDLTGDNKHRHINHLLGVFPGTYIVPGRSEEDDKLVEAVQETLRVRGDVPEGGTICWAFAWKSTVWAKLLNGEKAFADYKRLITAANTRNSVGDNLFDQYQGQWFQIDANLGGVAATAEMLLSSTGNRINPLPAIPTEWSEGSYEGLRARGDFTVNAKWKNNKLSAMQIISGSGKPCTLAYDDVYFAQITCDGKPVNYTVNDDDTVTFRTEAGKTYEIVQHTTHDVDVTERISPTCNAAGHTGNVYCKTCNTVLIAGNVIAQKQHKYVNGKCEFCGDIWIYPEKPFPVWATVSIAVGAVLCVTAAILFVLLRKKRNKGDK